MVPNIHLFNHWEWWRALNSEATWDQSHLRELGRKHQSTSCLLFLLHVCFPQHQSRFSITGKQILKEVLTHWGSQHQVWPWGTRWEFSSSWYLWQCLCLCYITIQRVELQSQIRELLGKTMMASFPFDARRDFSIQNWKCVQWNKQNTHSKPTTNIHMWVTTSQCTKKKIPNINLCHLNAQNPTKQTTKRESTLIKVCAINYPEWNAI